MKIYDISKEIFTSRVFPGDPAPKRHVIRSMESGSLYNLTAFTMCAHNGTHVDAPKHFIKDGKSIDQIDLSKFVGNAYVCTFDGILGATDAENVLSVACKALGDKCRKLLIKGKATVSADAAKVFANAELDLIGNESPTVGPEEAPLEVHNILLEKQIVLLESVVLTDVEEGVYMLSAAPILLGESDGAPCRALLIKF